MKAETLEFPLQGSSFHVVGSDEPHFTRRKEILKKYPQVAELYGYDHGLVYQVVFWIILQLFLSHVAPKLQSLQFWMLTYIVGGTASHILSMANHEIGHNLCFENPLFNGVLGLASNIAQGIPSFFSFQKYHQKHHFDMGVENKDPDLPTEWEHRIFDSSRLMKIIWVCLIPLWYSMRPMIVNPTKLTRKEILNVLVVFGIDYYIYKTAGLWGLIYLVLSTIFGMSLHPFNAHVIAEHYEVLSGQETYSYYGPMNYLCFNLGYHNEHHDFPRIPHTRLPLLSKIAPEFYETLASHDSWVKVLWDFIMSADLGISSRIKRDKAFHSCKAEPKIQMGSLEG